MHLEFITIPFLQALLFGAWVCILKYFDLDVFKNPNIDVEDSKEDFFKGITIWSWVMVILLVLTVIFSFDKICSRSSPWTLMVRKYSSPYLPNSCLLFSLPNIVPTIWRQKYFSANSIVASVHMSLWSVPFIYCILTSWRHSTDPRHDLYGELYGSICLFVYLVCYAICTDDDDDDDDDDEMEEEEEEEEKEKDEEDDEEGVLTYFAR